MYLSHSHNHGEWATCREEYNADWKENNQAKKKNKYEADAANPPNKSAYVKLSLSKIFKFALVTQVMLSNQESNQLVDVVLNGKFNEYYELKE